MKRNFFINVKAIVLMLVFGFIFKISWGQQNYVTWDFTTALSSGSYDATPANMNGVRTSSLTNATFTGITCVGVSPANNATTFHRSTGWPGSLSTIDASATNYTTFSITLASGQTFPNISFSLNLKVGNSSTTTAPVRLLPIYGYGTSPTFSAIGSIITINGTQTQLSTITIPAPGNTTTTKLTIRIAGYNTAAGTTGNMRLSTVALTGANLPTIPAAAPTITTPSASSITSTSATLGATITADGGASITARGTSYKTSTPVIETDNQLAEGGTSVAAFSHSRTSLAPQTRYYYAGYATNATGTSLSAEAEFRTLSSAPSSQSSGLTATAASSSQIDLSITAATFPSSGATQAGYVVIYSTGTPTLSSTNGTSPAAGVGSIYSTSAAVLPATPNTTVNVTGLNAATAYNFIVVPYTWDGTNATTYNYLTASAPTANATTNAGSPTLTTPVASAITNNAATLGATVTSNGGSVLTSRGTVYKTSASVTITNNALSEGGTAVAAFTHSRTSLSPETQYFYAGYASNSSANGLSSESSFRTLSNPPTVQAGLSAVAASTSQINLTITAATFPATGATQAGYIVIYSTGTPTLSSANGAAPAAGVGSIFTTSATVLPTTPSTSINVTGLLQATLYNFLIVPYTWDGANASTYNYLTASAPIANATTQSPVVIAIQDFETSPATPTLTYTNTNGSISSGINSAGLPANANLFVSGTNGWQAAGATSTLIFTNQSLAGFTNAYINFRLAGMSANGTNGIDAADMVTVSISVDGGSTYSSELTIAGSAGNQRWDFSATGTTTLTFDGDNTPTAVTSSSGSSGISTININIPNSNSQVSVKIVMANNANEIWVIDDIAIIGTVDTSPLISVSKSSLSTFAQTSSTPSAEQTYTVSGDNLTNDIDITAPTGFEISATSGSGFGSSITLAQSGGNIVGEPKTIYVQQNSAVLGTVSGNIAHASTGATTKNTAVNGARTGTYYSKSTGNLDDVLNWGLNTDGTGSNPSNFTSNGIIYEIRNRGTATISASWIVSGTSSKVVLGDGSNSVDFTIPSTASLTGTIDISANAELTIENATTPTFGTIADNSTIEYNNVAVTLSLSNILTYKNLKLSGTGTKTFPGHASNTTTIAGNLILNNTIINGAGSSPFSSILLGGNLTYIGTVTPPADGSSITLSTYGTAAGTQTITGAGNTLRWFRITSTSANTILLSTSGGSSNLLLGNASGGGITLIDNSVLDLNGNDLAFVNIAGVGGASFVLNTTGSISANSNSDFDLFRSLSTTMGTIRFTSGANTIGNLTLNHTGATNTLIIGNAVNVAGVITLTDGTLTTGGFITLKSDVTGTASIATLGSGAAISGNLTVERYIPSTNGRGYKYLAAPFSAGPTIANSWQQQIYITGTGSGGTICPSPTAHTSTGFDATSNSNPSMFVFDETTATAGSNNYASTWTSVANTNATNLTAGTGYNVYVRGARSQGCGILVYPYTLTANAVTLSASGTVKTGSASLPVTYTAGNGDGWNLVGNPYPCEIDWDATSGWTKTNIDNAVYMYNPAGDNYASYTTLGAVSVNGGQRYIPSGTAFFVKANAVSPALACTEAVKTSTNATPFLKGNKPFSIHLNLSYSNGRTDESFVFLNQNLTDGFDNSYDIEKLANPSNVNIYSIDASHKQYAANAIANLEDETEKILSLGIGDAYNGNYTLHLDAIDLPTYYQIFLRDHYLNQEQQLFVGDSLNYNFSVNNDSLSANNTRFDLFIANKRPHSAGLSKLPSLADVKVFPNPSKDIITVSMPASAQYVSSLVVYNVMGQMVKTIEHPKAEEQINLSELGAGMYFLSFLGNAQVLKTVKVCKN